MWGSDGITEDIITGLSQFKDLDVVARNSTIRYKGQSVDVRKVGHELGARYVLEGSVRKAGDARALGARSPGATRQGPKYPVLRVPSERQRASTRHEKTAPGETTTRGSCDGHSQGRFVLSGSMSSTRKHSSTGSRRLTVRCSSSERPDPEHGHQTKRRISSYPTQS